MRENRTKTEKQPHPGGIELTLVFFGVTGSLNACCGPLYCLRERKFAVALNGGAGEVSIQSGLS